MGGKIRSSCLGVWENLSPEQQQQVEEARQKFQAERDKLREEFIDSLLKELREQIQEKMEACQEQRGMKYENRHRRGCFNLGENN